MGCMNSKVINHHNSPSLSWEELLITSQSGTDQLIALVCSTTTNKPRTSNVTPPTEIPDMTTVGSRSFHTVEEYDALLENIRKFSTRSIRHFDDDDDDNCEVETETAGWKRKAVAKGLKPLQVSTTIEFPDSWQGEEIGHVDSPGTYVTPKFGSYNSKVRASCRRIRGEKEESVFSRELVTAFEDCMKQLRDDEASILWEMDVGVSENRNRD